MYDLDVVKKSAKLNYDIVFFDFFCASAGVNAVAMQRVNATRITNRRYHEDSQRHAHHRTKDLTPLKTA